MLPSSLSSLFALYPNRNCVHSAVGCFTSLLTVALLSTGASAQTTTPAVPAPAVAADKDVVPEKTLQLNAGYLFNLQKKGKDSSYYSISYTGQTLATKGTAFAAPTLTGPNLPAVAASGGDTHDLLLRLEHSAAQVHGGILDSLFQKPLDSLTLPFLKGFRGAVGVNATQDLKQIVYSGGLESPAIHPLRLLKLDPKKQIINWLFVGALDENSNVSGSGAGAASAGGGTSTDAGVAVYRGFIGKGFAPVTSGAEKARADKEAVDYDNNKILIFAASEKDHKFDIDTLLASTLALAPKYEKDKTSLTLAEQVIFTLGKIIQPEPLPDTAGKWEKLAGNQLKAQDPTHDNATERQKLFDAGETTGQFDYVKLRAAARNLPSMDPRELKGADKVILNLAGPTGFFLPLNPPSTEKWEGDVTNILNEAKRPRQDLASVQAWFASTGWYQFTKLSSDSLNKRYTNLLSANAKVYLDAKQGANNWLLFRFERGTERSAPDVYKNSFSTSVGFRF